jgi:hypothetical protein
LVFRYSAKASASSTLREAAIAWIPSAVRLLGVSRSAATFVGLFTVDLPKMLRELSRRIR